MLVVYLVYVYFITGFLFSVWFSFYKVKRVDESTAATSVWFKLIIMPATILLWPIVLYKAFQHKK